MAKFPTITMEFLQKIPFHPYAFPFSADTKQYEEFYGALTTAYANRGLMQDPNSFCREVRNIYDAYYLSAHQTTDASYSVNVTYDQHGRTCGLMISSSTKVNPTSTTLMLPLLKLDIMPDPIELTIMRLGGDYSNLTSHFRVISVTDAVIAVERFTQNYLKMTRNIMHRQEDLVPYPLGAY